MADAGTETVTSTDVVPPPANVGNAAGAEADSMAEIDEVAETAEATPNPHVLTYPDGHSIDYRVPPDVSFADGIAPDERGYRPITWGQLRRSFGYERVAHGFALTGDVCFRSTPQDYNPFVRLRDAEGGEGTVFFYDKDDVPNGPSFTMMHMGSTVSIRSPRFHRFLDGQEGMRLESNNSILRVDSRHHLSDQQRMDFAESHRLKGNALFEAGKYDEASREYDNAVVRLEGSFGELPALQAAANKLAATCQLNLSMCCMKERQWYRVEDYCEKALAVPLADEQKRLVIAKAYYRMGVAALELGNYTAATSHLRKSNDAEPNDPLVNAALYRLEEANRDRRRTEETIRRATARSGRPFGYCANLFSDDKVRVVNFRDIGEAERNGVKLKRHMLYRSSALTRVAADDLHVMTDVLGIKTVIDLRRAAEVSFILRRFDAAADSCHTHKVFKPTPYSASQSLSGRVTVHFDLLLNTILHIGRWWCIVLLFVGILVRWGWAIGFVIRRTLGNVPPSAAYVAVVDSNPRNIRQIFALLSKVENYPVVISCTLGKDRTGIVIALVLSVLGMSMESILEDFSISDRELRLSQSLQHAAAEWSSADATSLRYLLESLRERHGSVEGYIQSIGVTADELAKLRSILISE